MSRREGPVCIVTWKAIELYNPSSESIQLRDVPHTPSTSFLLHKVGIGGSLGIRFHSLPCICVESLHPLSDRIESMTHILPRRRVSTSLCSLQVVEPVDIPPQSSRTIYLGHLPHKPGISAAYMEVYTSVGTLNVTLRGVGMDSPYR